MILLSEDASIAHLTPQLLLAVIIVDQAFQWARYDIVALTVEPNAIEVDFSLAQCFRGLICERIVNALGPHYTFKRLGLLAETGAERIRVEYVKRCEPCMESENES